MVGRTPARGSLRPHLAAHVLLSALLLASAPRAAIATWSFTNVTTAAGFNYSHGYSGGVGEAHRSAGGVAVGDYDRDGWDDLYVVRGNIGPNLLFRNLGNGTFQEVGAAAGVNVSGANGCGPAFGDYDGDGWLDLFIGGVAGTQPRLYRNLGNGSFQNVTGACGIVSFLNTFSCTFGDYDRDDDLDVFLSHWDAIGSPEHLWRNNGNGTFTVADGLAGVEILGDEGSDYTYTGNFADITNDGWPDLLVASDFHRSKVFWNDGDGTFTNVTNAVISDENGMGAAVGDYDADGDLDWFVASIWDPNGVPEGNWGVSGNRLYQNQGAGTFADVTTAAGVRQGYWGWGSSFVDLNNDGHLDILHVNGWITSEFTSDPTRLFVSNGDGTFTERATETGIAHTGQGRGVACFDYDHDGDLDVFLANNQQAPAFFRNDGGNAGRYLDVTLQGPPPNTQGIGARIYAIAGGRTQMREMRAGSNFVSQDPARAHFGLGSANVVTQLRVEWPGGEVTILNGIAANQSITIDVNGTSVGGGAGDSGSIADLALVGAPNPFSEETRIRFRLPTPSPVRLDIVDAAGRIVWRFYSPSLPAGEHGLVWDGRDGAGSRVAQGRYLCRVSTIDGTAVRGLVLLR